MFGEERQLFACFSVRGAALDRLLRLFPWRRKNCWSFSMFLGKLEDGERYPCQLGWVSRGDAPVTLMDRKWSMFLNCLTARFSTRLNSEVDLSLER